MADIIPFRGTRYVPGTAGDVGRLISPPYDVIDANLREVLFHQSEYNIARIIKADRGSDDAPYAGAADTWQAWRRAGVVAPDDRPAFYVYEQCFELHGRKFSRTGLIALVRLTSLGEGVLPHESTLSGPRADRLELLRATRTNFGQVFALYPDPENHVDQLLDEVKQDRPAGQTADRQQQLHRLWAISDPERIERIQALMRDKRLLIADGHHRYETALAYRAENPDWPPAQYRMMDLVNTANVGLVVLPTHRLVKNVAEFDPEKLLARLRKHFDVRAYPGDSHAVRSAVVEAIENRQRQGGHAFALCLGDGRHYELVLRDASAMDDVADRSDAWKQLDVTILHHLILERILGITSEQIQAQTHIEYIQDFDHAIRAAAERVHAGQAQALFLINPTRIEDVLAVAENGERMPQKSTFFYPKVYSGLVFNCLDDSTES